MSLSPKISVIMAVYNGEKHLAEALDSILAQSFTDFECIIVDDASTDATPTILAGYAAQDARVRILRNTKNRERSYSRNLATRESLAPLIAVADADDWLHPDRLQRQYAFMQRHLDVAVCGSWISVYETGELWQWPVSDAEIHVHMLFNSPIAHPTAFFRKNVVQPLTGGYDEGHPLAEDYDLWERLSHGEGIVFGNIPEVLLRYRLYPEKDRSPYRDVQLQRANAVRLRQVRLLGLEPGQMERIAHSILAGAIDPQSLRELWACKQWVAKLQLANAKEMVYDKEFLKGHLKSAQRGLLRRLLLHRATSCWRTHAPESLKRAYRNAKALAQRK